MDAGLPARVETLYGAFARYPLPAQVDFCAHCIDPQAVVELHRTPLRQISAEQMGTLLANAGTTWGDQEYFNHFLPRLLELVAAGAMNDFSYPVFLPSRLAGPWQHGNNEERAAIDGFVWAWWQQTTSTHPSACQPWDVLDAIGSCDQDPRRFLDAWPVDAGEPATRQLASLVDSLLPVVEARTEASRTVNAWLLGPSPIATLRKALAATDEPDLARHLSDTVDHLQLCRKAYAAEAR